MDRKKVLGIFFLVLFVLGACWALGWPSFKDAEVAEIEQQRDELFTSRNETSEEERRSGFLEIRERISQLSPEQQRAVIESSRPIFQKMMMERMNAFFQKPPAEQKADLDRLIDAMESGGGPTMGPPGNLGSMSPEQASARMKQMLDRTTPEMRSKFAQFRTMMNERRQERGLAPVGP